MNARLFTILLSVLQQLRELSAGSDQDNGWTYHDEDWVGNDPNDQPSLFVLTDHDNLDDDTYCLSAKGSVGAGKPLKIAECNSMDKAQLFYWEDAKRMRPLADLSLCLDAGTNYDAGDVPRFQECMLKGSQQRWVSNGRSSPLSPRNAPEVCLIGEPDGKRIELGQSADQECIKWEQTDPDAYATGENNEPPQDDPNEEEQQTSEPADVDSDYVLIVSHEEDSGDYDVACLTAAIDEKEEIKMKECNRSSKKQLWRVQQDSDGTVELRPKSDTSLCLELKPLSKPPQNTYCCVDDPGIELKTCRGSKKQKWVYEKNLGFIKPKNYSTGADPLCLSKWFAPRVGVSHCGFPAIETFSYDDYRWDMVDPDRFIPVKDEQTGVLFTIDSGEDTRLFCEDNCIVLDDPDNEDEWLSADTLWRIDDEKRFRKGSDSSLCLTYDKGYQRLYESRCYLYKDDDQKWRYDDNGQKELSPFADLGRCAVARAGDDPPVKACDRSNEQRWDMELFGTASDKMCDDEDALGGQMLVLQGGDGYYCMHHRHEELGEDDGSGVSLRACDPTQPMQRFVIENKRLKPAIDPSFCVEPGKELGEWMLITEKCEGGVSRQKWLLPDTSGNVESVSKEGLCASFCDTYWYRLCLRDCDDDDSEQMFQRTSPEDYSPPTHKYVHLSTENDLDWAISCYPDTEENRCPGYRPIRLTYGKFHIGNKWFIEEKGEGIRFRRGEPKGSMLEVDGEDMWRYNEKGENEISSIKNSKKCLENRGQLGGGTTGDLTLATCNDKTRQRWVLQDTDEYLYRQGSIRFGKPNNLRLVISKQDASLCVAAKDAYARHPDGNIILEPCDASNDKQIWAVEDINGATRLRPRANLNTCMHVSRVDLLQMLHLEECDNDQVKQRWMYDEDGDDEFSPLKDRDLCVGYENLGCSPRGGSQLQLLPCSGKSEQSFRLIDPDEY